MTDISVKEIYTAFMSRGLLLWCSVRLMTARRSFTMKCMIGHTIISDTLLSLLGKGESGQVPLIAVLRKHADSQCC